ncbi:hypothetical protein KJ766_00820 [Patescibacteria group bacterium]|nr:hypothetical protein [Patescibacteria group bacterium]
MNQWIEECVAEIEGIIGDDPRQDLDFAYVVYKSVEQRIVIRDKFSLPHYRQMAELLAREMEGLDRPIAGYVIVRSRLRLGGGYENQIVFRLACGRQEVMWTGRSE